MAGADQLLPDVLVLALAVRRRGRHDESGAALFVQIGVKVGYPQIVGIADLFFLVHAGHAERQPPRSAGRL